MFKPNTAESLGEKSWLFLLPTTEVFSENVKQTHLQEFAWKYGLDSDLPDLSPENIRWLRITK